MARAVGVGTRLPRRKRTHTAWPLPTGTRSMARRGQPRGMARRVSCVPVAQSFALPCLSQISAFCALAARSPCICSRLRVALRCAQQPTGLTLPSGVLMVSLPRFGSLWAFGPSAHRAHASLRPLDTRNAGAERGRGRPAPMARAVGAGTRLPRRERARAAGPLSDGAEEHGPARTAAGCGEARFLRLSGARNARAACVRRKDGPCHSERRAGMGPARKRAATKPIPRTARAAAHGGRTCEATFFPQKRLTRRKDGAIIPASNAEGGRAGMKAARMDHSSAYYFIFSFTFARKALLRCAV